MLIKNGFFDLALQTNLFAPKEHYTSIYSTSQSMNLSYHSATGLGKTKGRYIQPYVKAGNPNVPPWLVVQEHICFRLAWQNQ